MPPDLISLRARLPFPLLFLLLPLNGAFSVLLLCVLCSALLLMPAVRPLAFQVEWIFISELAGRREGGRDGGR